MSCSTWILNRFSGALRVAAVEGLGFWIQALRFSKLEFAQSPDKEATR